MRQKLIRFSLLILLIGVGGCSNDAPITLSATKNNENANVVSSSSGSSSSPSSSSFSYYSSSSSSSSFSSSLSSSSSFKSSEPPSSYTDEDVDIHVCIFYAKEKLNRGQDGCDCMHCMTGVLSISMSGVGQNQIYQLNQYNSPRSLILGGTRMLNYTQHPNEGASIDGYYMSDIPGVEYSGGQFDSKGEFKLNTSLSNKVCITEDDPESPCYRKEYKTDTVLYSIIGKIDGRYFIQGIKQLKIGDEVKIKRSDVVFENKSYHFDNWCELVIGER